jgi:hypothetical protein
VGAGYTESKKVRKYRAMVSFQSDNGVMVNGKMLTEKTKEELIEIIFKERERSVELEAEIN